MGVPAFYRWLSEKYPKIVQDILEDRVHLAPDSNSITLPFDLTKPNPSGLECDNLYIDMNGIIHPCSHPENGPQPKCEEDMYDNICRYVDRLMRAARPRKLLYLAIDGVAPRAKMNQQRARRFRSAQEIREQKQLEEEIKDSLIQAGHKFESKGTSNAWDSNVITPGTKFMLNLSDYVRFYIRKRISTDPAWKHLTIIFSDASIPGEGEHKIMSHVRLQRTQPDYNPNLVHILHGLDADLIMLALATHEAHFYIMREEVLFGRKGAEQAEQKREESGFADAQQQLDQAAGSEAMTLPENKFKVLQRISIPILREYLAFEFGDVLKALPQSGFKDASFERLIDDIVFLCFFVGNDFLPHLPSLDIRDGALDFLFNVYKRILPSLGDFITDHGGEVNLSRVDVILAEVGAIEDYVFQLKNDNEKTQKKRREEATERRKRLKNGHVPYANHHSNSNADKRDTPNVRGRAARILEKRSDATNSNEMGKAIALGTGESGRGRTLLKEAKKNSLEDNLRAAEELKSSLTKKGNDSNDNDTVATESEAAKDGAPEEANSSPTKKRKYEISEDESKKEKDEEDQEKQDDKDEQDVDEFDQGAHDEAMQILKTKLKDEGQKKLNTYAENVEDNVRLHEAGWKNRYYTDKCKADDVLNHGGKEHLFRSYVVGLCWVMKYYYDGCPSWKWYYPFHYGPFASDLRNIERFQKDCSSFELNEPFTPVEQLMAVLPEDSSHAIPASAKWLMSDRESPIIDFYPKDVPCDPNGKAMPWLWVVLLPFIDEDRLLSALHPTMKDWKEFELLCNTRGIDDGYIYCHVNHDISSSLVPTLDSQDKSEKLPIENCKVFGLLRRPLSNEVYPLDQVSTIHPPSSSTKIHDTMDELLTSPIETNAALCAAFTEPKKVLHKSILLGGAQPPPPVLGQSDFRIRRPRLNRGGGTIANMGGGGRGQSHQVGYGSMNIGAYERELAYKSGRGGQMNQAGTRQWGAMEPTPKRPRIQNGHGQFQSNQQHHQQYRPSFQQGNYQNSHHSQGRQNNGHRHNGMSNPQGNQYQQQSTGQRNQWHQSQPRQMPPPAHHQAQRSQQSQPRQGYNFQNYNTNRQQQQHHHSSNYNHRGGHSYSRNDQAQSQHQQQSQRSGLSSNVMSNLRSQLASTLNKNRQKGDQGGRK